MKLDIKMLSFFFYLSWNSEDFSSRGNILKKTGDEPQRLNSELEIKMDDGGSRTRGFTQFNCLVLFFDRNDIKLWGDLAGGVYLIATLMQSEKHSH